MPLIAELITVEIFVICLKIMSTENFYQEVKARGDKWN